MARRRRSIFSTFRSLKSLTRNIKMLVSTVVGLGLVGGLGYFTFAGSSYSLLPVSFDAELQNVVYGEADAGAESNSNPAEPAAAKKIKSKPPKQYSGSALARARQVEADAIAAAKIWIPKLLPKPKSNTEIAIGTFNVQRFGQSQLSRPEVMRSLVEISQEFDVLAIQEITHKNGRLLHTFVEILNMVPGNQFDYLISPLLGRKDPGAYQEQFGFIYDRNRVRLKHEDFFGFVVSEKKFGSKFDRLPVVTQFRVAEQLHPQPFTFSLINVHTVPSKVAMELVHLNDVYRDVQRILADEDDIILLGDFNASHEVISKSLSFTQTEIKTAITAQATNLKQTASYDNIVFNPSHTQEFQTAIVVDFRAICRKNGADPSEVSDHFPVKATFRASEAASARVAMQAGF